MSDDCLSLNDPTKNVLDHVALNTKRLDDLVCAGFASVNQKIDAEVHRIDEKIALQSSAAESLNFAESKRLDAIRAVDINAVAVASERATAQASVLATQVVASAETLRTLVASTAATVAQQLSQLSSQLSDRISALEKASYEGVGKGKVVDPQMEALITQVQRLTASTNTQQGSGHGADQAVRWIIAGIGLIILVASFILTKH